MSEPNTIYMKLGAIQHALKAPKESEGRFGKSRSAEDILASLKPLLPANEVVLLMTDELVQIGERNYIRSTVALVDQQNGENRVSATAFAWEGDITTGNDASQMTGKAASYARKYALGALFAIDDTKDADFDAEPPKVTRRPAVGTTAKYVTSAQAGMLLGRAKQASGLTDRNEVLEFFKEETGVELAKVRQDDVERIIAVFGGDIEVES